MHDVERIAAVAGWAQKISDALTPQLFTTGGAAGTAEVWLGETLIGRMPADEAEVLVHALREELSGPRTALVGRCLVAVGALLEAGQ